ncbi:hypothetical protein ACFL0L_03405 [Patescibacteria group bacterium]
MLYFNHRKVKFRPGDVVHFDLRSGLIAFRRPNDKLAVQQQWLQRDPVGTDDYQFQVPPLDETAAGVIVKMIESLTGLTATQIPSTETLPNLMFSFSKG